jgi:hypothetical protein
MSVLLGLLDDEELKERPGEGNHAAGDYEDTGVKSNHESVCHACGGRRCHVCLFVGEDLLGDKFT